MTAGTTDWILKGVKGEFYPCRDDIFQETYDKADEDCRDEPALVKALRARGVEVVVQDQKYFRGPLCNVYMDSDGTLRVITGIEHKNDDNY